MLKHPLSEEVENILDVGSGCGQILSILVAGYSLKKGSIFVVEDPEIHLHPRAQAELGDFFKDLLSNGVQSFVETHSEHFLLRILSYIASGKIKPDDVRIYYVYATEKGKQIKFLPVDNQGFFKEEWPEGFFPERLEEAEKIAKASLKK